MLVSALPAIAREYGSIESASWLITGFLLAQAAVAAVGGRLGDIYGRRRVLAVLIGFCLLGSAMSALAPNLDVVVWGRVVQGASGAMLPLCLGIMRELAPPAKVPFYNGILIGGYAFSGGGGYILGGVLADGGGWRLIFWATLIYALPLLPLLFWRVPKGVVRAVRLRDLDILGGVLVVPAIALLLLGISQGAVWGMGAASTWLLIGGGLAVLVFWACYELRHPDPLIDVRMFRDSKILAANLSQALFALGTAQTALVMIMILQQPVVAGVGLAVSATTAALLKLPSNVGTIVAAPFAGWLAGKRGARTAAIVAGLFGAGGWVFLNFFHGSVWSVVLGGCVCVWSGAMLSTSIPNLALESAPVERSSEVVGVLSVTQRAFIAIGAQTALLLLASDVVIDPASGARLPSDYAYQATFAAFAVLSALIAIVCMFAGRGHRVRDKEALVSPESDHSSVAEIERLS